MVGLFGACIRFSHFRIREKLGSLVVNMLNRKSEAVDYACVEMLCSLMQPMHANYELRLEQLNKQSLLSSKPFVEHLLNLIVNHVVSFLFCLCFSLASFEANLNFFMVWFVLIFTFVPQT